MVDDQRRRVRQVKKLARELIEHPTRIGIEGRRHRRIIDLTPRRYIVKPSSYSERVTDLARDAAEHRGPYVGAPRQAACVLEADSTVVTKVRFVEKVQRALVVDHRQVAPLGQVERKHADAPFAQPRELGIPGLVVERHDEK